MLDALLDGARAGRSGVLVVRGEAGIGKTALLRYVIESAADLRVVRAVGVESEMELAFAALHQLCGPMLDGLERLPGPQRTALEVTFGLRDGAVPDRFFVGLAVLGLLAEAAEERALVCVVDDAQWLDKASAQTLAFVARRLLAESVVMTFAARKPGEELRGLPELVIEGLKESDARQLLRSLVPGRLDERVYEQVLAETRGNPLALLELTRGLSPEQLAGGFALSGTLSFTGRIEERFRQQLQALPEDSQRLLLVTAADPTGDPALLWRAAGQLGIADSVLEPAEGAGLLRIGRRVRFRHPLVRSAVYRAAPREERRRAHRALAEATDPSVDPDRRAWHLAEAAAGADENVAAELERSAGRAQARGGLAAAAAFLERAVALTPDSSVRAERALAAAHTKLRAGAWNAVEGLVATAEGGPLSELRQARADLLRAQLVLVTKRGRDAAPLLVSAAKRLEPIAPNDARATYRDALMGAYFAGHLAAPGGSLPEVARAASTSPPHAPSAVDLLIDGVAANFDKGYAEGVPVLRRALEGLEASRRADQELRAMPIAYIAAMHVWDDGRRETITERWLWLIRETGTLSELPIALNAHAVVVLFAGDASGAASLVEEARAASEATGIAAAPYAALWLAALQSREAELMKLAETTVSEATARGEGLAQAFTEYATATLYNGLGRYEAALTVVGEVVERSALIGLAAKAVIELIEAAARCRQLRLAERAFKQLEEMTDAAGTNWALGVEARSRALLSDGDGAENLYREAIARLALTRMRVELARAHLLYGEWLRRERRRVEAREQLRTADEMFTQMGVGAFVERTERELRATGEHTRKRVVENRDDLTAQEVQIAQLARDGLANPEIGARLFISRRTVEYHLTKVFTKLGISSRHELDRALPPQQIATPTSSRTD